MLPAIIRKMHLAHCLETQNWEGIRKDLDTRPIEGTNGKATEDEILRILHKYGISMDPDGNRENPVTRHSSFVTLSLWGTGQVFREFLHVDDMAAVCVKTLEEINVADLTEPGLFPSSHAHPLTFFNIGTGEDQTIAEIAALVKSIVGFTGEINWDNSKPDGTLRKLLDVSKLRALGVTGYISLENGIRAVYKQYTR